MRGNQSNYLLCGIHQFGFFCLASMFCTPNGFDLWLSLIRYQALPQSHSCLVKVSLHPWECSPRLHLWYAKVSLCVFVIVHFTSRSRSLISSQGYTCPWHFRDCEEAFSPAGTKNSWKYRNELIMDHAKTTTTKNKQASKQINKQTSKKLK